VGQATLLAFAVSLASDLSMQRKPLIKALYNASLVAVTLRVASVAFSLERLLPTHGRVESEAMAFLAAGVLYWFVNRVGVAAIIALASRIPMRQAWRDNFGFGYEFLSTSVQVVLAGILAAGWPILGPTGLAGMGLLLFFVNDAYRRRNQLEELATHETDEKKAA
jgi:hypothetical protein